MTRLNCCHLCRQPTTVHAAPISVHAPAPGNSTKHNLTPVPTTPSHHNTPAHMPHTLIMTKNHNRAHSSSSSARRCSSNYPCLLAATAAAAGLSQEGNDEVLCVEQLPHKHVVICKLLLPVGVHLGRFTPQQPRKCQMPCCNRQPRPTHWRRDCKHNTTGISS